MQLAVLRSVPANKQDRAADPASPGCPVRIRSSRIFPCEILLTSDENGKRKRRGRLSL